MCISLSSFPSCPRFSQPNKNYSGETSKKIKWIWLVVDLLLTMYRLPHPKLLFQLSHLAIKSHSEYNKKSLYPTAIFPPPSHSPPHQLAESRPSFPLNATNLPSNGQLIFFSFFFSIYTTLLFFFLPDSVQKSRILAFLSAPEACSSNLP